MKRIMKQITAVLCVAMAVLFTMPAVAQAAGSATFTVTADKTKANPGDTINYTVKLGAVSNLGGMTFYLTIPSGLTINASSIQVPDGMKATLDSAMDIVVPSAGNSYKWDHSAGSTGYTGTSDLVILKFSCTVDTDCSFEAKSVTLNVEDCIDQDADDISTTVVPASVTIEKKTVAVTGVSLNQTKATLQEGNTLQLTATVEPATADEKTVSWNSSNLGVATVSTTGLVTAVAEGTANITVTTQDGNKTAMCAVTVPHQHSMSALTPAQDATCTAAGNVAYYTCTKCTKKYSDDAGENELTDVVVAAKGHKAGSEWKTDTDNHWKECTNTGCTTKLQLAAHSYQWKVDTAATEDSTGIKHEECVCGVKRSENTEIPKLDHVHIMTDHPTVPATCSKEGKKQYWTCSSAKCTGKIYGDADGQIEVTEDSLTLAKVADAHVYDNASDGTCDQCGFVRFYVVIEGANETYSIGSSEGLVFRVDGDFDKFSELKINNKTVDKSYYTAVSGSTIITLKSSYLDTLPPAKYAVEVIYADGKVATTTLNIAEKDNGNAPAEDNANASTGDDSSASESVAKSSGPVSPKTGEEAAYMLWLSILAGVVAAAAGVLTYRKKRIS